MFPLFVTVFLCKLQRNTLNIRYQAVFGCYQQAVLILKSNPWTNAQNLKNSLDTK
jgi:hypothetical protein